MIVIVIIIASSAVIIRPFPYGREPAFTAGPEFARNLKDNFVREKLLMNLVFQQSFAPQLLLTQSVIRNEILRRKLERESSEQLQGWAKEVNKSYERRFQEIQAIFLTNLAYAFGAQQMFSLSLSS